ncbi:MAG: proline racemase family protein [Thermoplasmata archaeon]|nr:proline racemase family protein [Thermoplasmata archaeon]
MQRVHVVDSHTAGEPTRVVLSGGPDLGTGSIEHRLLRFRELHDEFRRSVVQEPRGSGAVVGALVVPPDRPKSTAGVIFFNNAGYLGMCGHGTIGLVATLAHTGQIRPGRHTIETPVGTVEAELHAVGDVSVRNVACRRTRTGVEVEVPGYGPVVGDIAWGGNWFFLSEGAPCDLTLANVEPLTAYTKAIRAALDWGRITGSDGATVDHIEISGPPARAENQSRNFVLCPGGEYDRSPCGTGTSAKVACLMADGRLRDGQVWRQEGILGTVFEVRADRVGDELRPRIRGSAYITGEGDLLFDSRDPFVEGVAP